MFYKYRLWCNVHGWVYEWSETEITECPIEPTDSVNTSKIFIVKKEIPVISLIPSVSEVKSKDYTRVASVLYDASALGPVSRLSVFSNMEKGVDSYDIEVYNRDSNSSLVESNFSNDGDVEENDVGLIISPPENKVRLEINMRRNGSKKSKGVKISQIILYTRKEFD